MPSKKPLILVAEDDSLYARIYQVKLAKEGYDVVVVGDGRLAVKKAHELKPDLILMDLIMPDMDGFAALKEIKKSDKTRKLRVVVMSNLGQESDMQKAIEMGAEKYFIKANVSMTEMVGMIKDLIGGGVVIEKAAESENIVVAEEKNVKNTKIDSVHKAVEDDGIKILKI